MLRFGSELMNHNHNRLTKPTIDVITPRDCPSKLWTINTSMCPNGAELAHEDKDWYH